MEVNLAETHNKTVASTQCSIFHSIRCRDLKLPNWRILLWLLELDSRSYWYKFILPAASFHDPILFAIVENARWALLFFRISAVMRRATAVSFPASTVLLCVRDLKTCSAIVKKCTSPQMFKSARLLCHLPLAARSFPALAKNSITRREILVCLPALSGRQQQWR